MPNSRLALHGKRPSLIHGLCAICASNSHGAFFRPLLTPVSTAPVFASLSVHGLHITVCTPSSTFVLEGQSMKNLQKQNVAEWRCPRSQPDYTHLSISWKYHSTENHYITSRYFSELIMPDVMYFSSIMVCEIISQQCQCMLGCLTSAWNTKITLHQSLGINC